MRQMSQLEEVLGSHGRSGQQLEAWESVYGPVDEDGYPRPLWDKRTGKIDHEVAKYMRDHGYDLTAYLKANWQKLGPQLQGKLHFYCGEMDNFYLNVSVYMLEDFLKTTGAGATFEYGRPMKGHGWHPMSNAELVRMMAAQASIDFGETADGSGAGGSGETIVRVYACITVTAMVGKIHEPENFSLHGGGRFSNDRASAIGQCSRCDSQPAPHDRGHPAYHCRRTPRARREGAQTDARKQNWRCGDGRRIERVLLHRLPFGWSVRAALAGRNDLVDAGYRRGEI